MMEIMTMPSLNILVVDDEIPLLRALVRQLRGHTLYLANDFSSAMTEFQSHPIDLVLCDYNIPGTDGLTLLETFRRLNPRVRRVLMSSNPPDYLKELLISGVIEHFIPKPFAPELSRELINFVMRTAGNHDRLTTWRPSGTAATHDIS